MSFNLLAEIRAKSREEWLEVVRDRVTDIRIWIQERPEKAFIVSFILGAIVVLFFKLIAWVVFLALVVAAAAYFYAWPAAQMSPGKVTGSSSDRPTSGKG